MYLEVKPGICSIIKIDNVEDVLAEAIDKLVDAIILFCQVRDFYQTIDMHSTHTLSRVLA